jgi:hypothetical protein
VTKNELILQLLCAPGDADVLVWRGGATEPGAQCWGHVTHVGVSPDAILLCGCDHEQHH